ncbi:MAG TPA: malto-oligosyltrehalose synthase [Lapillicoccus sp.]|uniref:malto-oligosyltrehalose synthase n=1 Tax=Lapillicoccus sp. TaxID=1909287 RepID=UPI002F951C99
MTDLTAPRAERRVPTATYRLQVQAAFGFDDVSALAGYLSDLGVSHAYLSPVLQATPGSTHGYDVLDHGRLSDEAGGRAAFDAMVAALHERRVGVVVDIVPNHMTVPEPEHLNAPLWSVLREGRESAYAVWFDVDWDAAGDRIVIPVLGGTVDEALASGDLVTVADGGPDGDEAVVRYFDHELPVRPATENLPLAELLDRQWWRLESWRAGASTLNYRRFFDVGSLVAVRVEEPDVFDATHALVVDLVREGLVDGLRIDHPDGLADPRGYLRRLAEVTDDAWVVVEKILEGDERLPGDWPCAGTTGYDLLWRIGALFVDPAGEQPLTDQLAFASGARLTLDEVVTASKQQVVATTLVPEVLRLARRADEVLAAPSSPAHPPSDSVVRALVALLVAMDRYRAYVVPGEAVHPEAQRALDTAAERAREHLSEEDHPTLDVVCDLVLGRVGDDVRAEVGPALDDLVVRFQQTCGPVMAKGIEDTAFYRWHRLVGLNEVGADPDHFAESPDELTDFVERLAQEWPLTMTTLSTHDTKRSEDLRARLAVVSERPEAWQHWVREAQEAARPYRSERLDGATEYLLWQTLVGVWPIDEDRLQVYATKAVREAKLHTGWSDPDEEYEAAVAGFVSGVLQDERLRRHVASWVTGTAHAARAGTLGQKLLQLVLPGIPDVYQGTELVDLSLVDPDNRRPVDFGLRAERLARLDGGAEPDDLDDEKLVVTSRALRLRRDRPEWFTGPTATVRRVRTDSDHAFAVARGDSSGDHVVAVVTRLAASLDAWADERLELPAGTWTDLLTGRALESDAEVPLARILDRLPVALLTRTHV